jgi:hypothetical protein
MERIGKTADADHCVKKAHFVSCFSTKLEICGNLSKYQVKLISLYLLDRSLAAVQPSCFLFHCSKERFI